MSVRRAIARPRIVAPRGSAVRVWGEVLGALVMYGLLTVVFLLLPRLLLVVLGMSLDLRGRTAVALGGTLLGEVVALGLLLAWLRRRGRSLADLGWGQPTTPRVLLLGLVFGLAYAAYTLSNPAIGAHAAELSLFKVWGAGVGCFGALVEEIVFRGFVLTELDRIRTPVWLQVLVSGILFGLLHAGFSPAGIALTVVMGLVLAAVYRLGRRSLTPVALSHAVINLLIEPVAAPVHPLGALHRGQPVRQQGGPHAADFRPAFHPSVDAAPPAPARGSVSRRPAPNRRRRRAPGPGDTMIHSTPSGWPRVFVARGRARHTLDQQRAAPCSNPLAVSSSDGRTPPRHTSSRAQTRILGRT